MFAKKLKKMNVRESITDDDYFDEHSTNSHWQLSLRERRISGAGRGLIEKTP